MAAAPASFDVFDAFEQLGGFGTAVSLANCGDQAVAVGRDIAPTAAFGMAEHDEEAARDVDDLQMIVVCFLQDRQIAVFRRGCNHAGQGWNLTELDRVDVFEGIEVDDHAMLALRNLFRQKAVPIVRAWRALHVFRFHAAAFEIFEISGVISVSDHVLGDAAAAEVPSHRLDLHGMDAHPAVDDLAGGIRADLFLFEVADIAGGFEEGAGLARDIREDWGCTPVLLRLPLLNRRHSAVELRKPRAFPALDILVLGIVALDKNALAGPATDQRRLRAIGGHIAATRADKCDDRVGRAGAAEALFAFLRPLSMPGGGS